MMFIFVMSFLCWIAKEFDTKTLGLHRKHWVWSNFLLFLFLAIFSSWDIFRYLSRSCMYAGLLANLLFHPIAQENRVYRNLNGPLRDSCDELFRYYWRNNAFICSGR